MINFFSVVNEKFAIHHHIRVCVCVCVCVCMCVCYSESSKVSLLPGFLYLDFYSMIPFLSLFFPNYCLTHFFFCAFENSFIALITCTVV